MAGAGRPVRRLADLAAMLGRSVEGEAATVLSGVASLEAAGPDDLAFVRSARYAAALEASRAGAVILPAGLDAGGRPAIRSPDPALDFARVARVLSPGEPAGAGVHPGAHVDVAAVVDPAAAIGAAAVIGARTTVGAGTTVHGGAVLYADVVVGEDCTIHAGVVLREGTRLGDRVVLQPGAVLGGDGFGFVTDESGARVRMPHLGGVVVEDDVEIGANTTIDRGSLGETRIRRGAKIDNLVQIAHNCDVGEDAIIVAQAGLSGSTRLRARALVMAQAGSAGHLEVGEGAFVGARAGLHKDVPAGARVFGAPALEDRAWHRAVTAFARLPEMLRRLRRVERALGLRAAPRGGPGASGSDEPSGPER